MYSAEQRIVARNLQHDKDNLLKLVHDRLEVMRLTKTMNYDLER